MPRSRSRSRSRGRRGTEEKHAGEKKDERKEWPKEGVAEAAKSGSSEQEIVSVAIRQLPGDIRERLEKLFEEGLLKEGDLDLRSITVFASLNEGLQGRVMNHMENERIYVANARSKSGFLIATCDKAKTGCLDARGLGAIDPWRTALVAMATPKQKMVDLKPERDWLEEHDEGAAIKINVNCQSVESEVGVPSITVELPISETSASVKAKLVAMGLKSIPANRMKLHTEPVGFLKERHTFAFYNLADGITLTLSERKRAGTRFRSDHTVMPKRPRTQPQPGETASPNNALQKLVGGQAPGTQPAAPAMPKLPTLPGIGGIAPNGLAGLLSLPGLPMPGTAPAGAAPATALSLIPGMRPGLLPLPGGLTMPGAGGSAPSTAPAPAPALQLGNLSTLPLTKSGVPSAPGTELGKGLLQLPGVLPLGTSPATGPSLTPADPKAAALANPLGLLIGDLAKAKAPLPGFLPPGADPKAAAMAMMAAMNEGSKPFTADSKAAPPGMAPAFTPPFGFDPKSMMAMMGDQTKAPPPMPQAMGAMAKASAGIPDLGAPPTPSFSSVYGEVGGPPSKAQMPFPAGAIPKCQASSPMDNANGPPLSQAFAAAAGKASSLGITISPGAPMGATAKGAGPPPS